jgi:DNA-binding response OmpR family regulator
MSANHASADRLLVLDDTPELAELIGELGEKAGFDAHVTTDIDSFNEALERDAPDVIALDLQMPGTDGIEVLRQLAATACNAKVLLVTGMDRQTVISAKRFGRQLGLNLLGAVQKPFTPEALIAALSQGRSATGQLCANDLEEAIESGKLVLRYQPVVRRLESRVWHAESVEALPRWNHPEFGVLTPTQFIPLIASEKSALMRHLSDFVLVHGAQQLRQWQSTGVHLGLRHTGGGSAPPRHLLLFPGRFVLRRFRNLAAVGHRSDRGHLPAGGNDGRRHGEWRSRALDGNRRPFGSGYFRNLRIGLAFAAGWVGLLYQ